MKLDNNRIRVRRQLRRLKEKPMQYS